PRRWPAGSPGCAGHERRARAEAGGAGDLHAERAALLPQAVVSPDPAGGPGRRVPAVLRRAQLRWETTADEPVQHLQLRGHEPRVLQRPVAAAGEEAPRGDRRAGRSPGARARAPVEGPCSAVAPGSGEDQTARGCRAWRKVCRRAAGAERAAGSPQARDLDDRRAGRAQRPDHARVATRGLHEARQRPAARGGGQQARASRGQELAL
ncbi:unnamed protein product, partial [Prorocentrum cordatum]